MTRFSTSPLVARLSARVGHADGYAELAGSPSARPLRFLIVGGMTFALNVGLLVAFTSLGLGSIVAYAIALGLAVQFNFVVNQLLVWHDRPVSLALRPLATRWFSFHAWIAFSLLINMAAFALAQAYLPDIAAAVVAVACSTLVKFLSLDRFTFRARVAS